MNNKDQEALKKAAPKRWSESLPDLILKIFIGVAVLATIIITIALYVYGAIETIDFLRDLFSEKPEEGNKHNEVLFQAIEIVDLFLLATAVQVVSLGIFQLNFDHNFVIPEWLQVKDLEDLKSTLVGVVITMLGVNFLGQALVWTGGIDLTYLGIGVSVVILALTYFLTKIDRHIRNKND